MVEAIRSAICFLSVISFSLTFKRVIEEVDFFTFIFLIALQTVLGCVFEFSEVQNFCHDVFFSFSIICLALAFSYLKASMFSAAGL